jgi:hypothetical protein
MINIYFALLLIIPEALYEGLRAKHPKASFAVEFFFRFAIAVILFAVAGGFSFNGTQDYFIFHVLGYALLRFAIFDYCYNMAAELPFFYLGNTKIYDVYLSKVPGHLIAFVKAIALFMGIVFLLK